MRAGLFVHQAGSENTTQSCRQHLAAPGEPAAKLVPVQAAKKGQRKLGVWEGQGLTVEDFDAIDTDIERLIDESEIFPSGDDLWKGE